METLHHGRFREMFVYQKSFDLAVRIFRLTKAFPKEELFGLTSGATVPPPAPLGEASATPV
ncbi:MAG: four helix bundle protein [Flavobacteriales bacterium]|nr:four helix bundle protein [Flavobacteriales bacterium]